MGDDHVSKLGMIPYAKGGLNKRDYVKIYKLSLSSSFQLIEEDNKGKSGVYGFINEITGELYIGSAVDLFKRFKEHVFTNKTNIRLKRSIEKYGIESFSFIIFAYHEGDKSSITLLETKYLQSMDTMLLFNFKETATSMIGYKHTEEALQKMRERMSGDKHPMFGKGHTDEAKAKISVATSGERNPMFGKGHTDITKAIIKEKKSLGMVEVIDKYTKSIQIFSDASEAAKALNVHKTTVGIKIKSGKLILNKYIVRRISDDNEG